MHIDLPTGDDDQNMTPLLLTLGGAAAALSVSPRTVRRLLEAGELTPIRIGRSLRVSTADLQVYIDRRMTQGNNAPGVAVHGESTCHDVRPRPDRDRASTNDRVRRIGGPSTPTDAGARLAVVLGLPSRTTPKA